jgi:glycosyltransferase involved in cell wall biosynthesis
VNVEPVKVLVWGTAAQGSCAYYRGHLYDEPLAELGVEMRHIDRLPQHNTIRSGPVLPKNLPPAEVERMIREGSITVDIHIDTDDLKWCDVVMFRRYYNTFYRCALEHCEFRTHDEIEARAHPHGIRMFQPNIPARDGLTAAVWTIAAQQQDKGILYETDDLLTRASSSRWNGMWPDMEIEEPLVSEMARRADLVTVSTPRLAKYMSVLNPRTVVIRNAVNPALYTPTEPRPDDAHPRLVYYGGIVRMRDYAGYPDPLTNKWSGGYPARAVSELGSALHTIFLGAKPEQVEILRPFFNDVRPYIENIQEFCTALANTHGDIGVAPVLGDTFDSCKSELHWLEYTAAGMATIATRLYGDGPYNVIRDGVDGVLARGRQDWYDGMKKLLDPSFRADIAAAAKERVLAEYDYRKRAVEWADAFRWVSEHRGIGWSDRKAA